jgi:hypothetical protein
MEDTLARAGVDLDQMLNQQYMGFQEKGQDRMMQMIQQVLGAGSGAQPSQTYGSAIGESAGGYLASEGFRDFLSQSTKMLQDRFSTTQQEERRRGFDS